MNEATTLYKKLATSSSREFEAKISINGIEYQSEIIDFNIQGTLSSSTNDIMVGQTPSLRISINMIGYTRTSNKAIIRPYVRFITNDEISEWLPLGLFISEAPIYEKNQTSITGYDTMLTLENEFMSELSYPCLVGDLLDEILTQYNLQTDFVCNEYQITQPIGYTTRELLGYIASLHAGNAIFNARGNLEIVRYHTVVDTIDLKNCFAQSTDDTPFTIKKVSVTSGTKTYTYGKGTDYETLAYKNPFVDKNSINNIGAELVNVIVSNITIQKQGTGLYTLGERLKTLSNTDQSTTLYMIVSDIELEFADGSFVETIKSYTRTEADESYIKSSTLAKESNTITKQLTEYVYSYSNESSISIGSSVNTILSIKVVAEYNSTPMFMAYINLNCTTPGTFVFKYYLNSSVQNIIPKATLTEGYHIINLMLPLSLDKNTVTSFVVTCESDTGIASIDMYQIQAAIRGQGLAATGAKWDGNIELECSMPTFIPDIKSIDLGLNPYITNINFNTVAPTGGYLEGSMPIMNITDNLDLSFGMNYTVSATTKEEEM